MAGTNLNIGSRRVLGNTNFAAELGVELQDAPAMKQAWRSVDHAWLEAPVNEMWTAAFRLFVIDGWPTVGEVRIFPTEDFQHRPPGEWSAALGGFGARKAVPPGGLTTSVISQIRFGAVRKEIGTILRRYTEYAPQLMQGLGLAIAKPNKRKSAAGRPAIPDYELARIAAYYARRCDRGSLSPVADVAKEFAIDKHRARSRLYEARRRGLLAGGHRGAAGGTLTEKGKQLLQQKPNTRPRKGTNQ